MDAKRLSDSEIESELKDYPGWAYKEGKLVRELDFPTFIDAFSFLSASALISEKLNHHAELWNSYTKVKIVLWTHDAGGVSLRDFNWIRGVQKHLSE